MAPEFLNDLVGDNTAEWLTKLALAVLVVVATRLFVMRIATFIIKQALHLTQRTTTDADERVIQAIEPPLRFLLYVVGLWIAIIVMDFSTRITHLTAQVATSLIAVAIFWAAYRLVDVVADEIAEFSERDARIDRNIVRFGRQLVKGIVIVFAFVIVMDQFGYNLNGVLAGLGIGGLAVALAAQEALSNLIGYFVIMADSPFNIGDYIVSDTASGVVESIGFRSTQVRALDQGIIYVPNSTMANTSITNWSRLTKRRLDMNVGITYDASPDQVLAVVNGIRDMLEEHPRVMEDTVFVQFLSFNDSSLDIRVICYIDEPMWTLFQIIKEGINIKIMEVLTSHGAEFAFPTRTVVLQQAEPPVQSLPMPEREPESLDGSPHDPDMKRPQPDEPAGTEEIIEE